LDCIPPIFISESFRKYLRNIPGKHEVKELQKSVILGAAHILRKVLMYRYGTFNIRNNITCNINCKYITAATLYTLETWFV